MLAELVQHALVLTGPLLNELITPVTTGNSPEHMNRKLERDFMRGEV